MHHTPFIAVEGPIGAGKTSLAQAISNHYRFHLLQEIVEEHPYLDKFYQDMREWSFQTEMFFLCNRFKQIEEMQRDYLALGKPVVSDYHIFKNLIFAGQTLSDKHYAKFRSIYRILTDDLPQPTVVIYLHSSLPTLLQRIKKRGRTMEEKIDPEYLVQLSADYELAMQQLTKSNPDLPVLRINGDDCDFVEHQEDLAAIFFQKLIRF